MVILYSFLQPYMTHGIDSWCSDTHSSSATPKQILSRTYNKVVCTFPYIPLDCFLQWLSRSPLDKLLTQEAYLDGAVFLLLPESRARPGPCADVALRIKKLNLQNKSVTYIPDSLDLACVFTHVILYLLNRLTQ